MRPWWLRLVKYTKKQKRGLLGILLLMLVGVALDVLKPWPLKLIVDNVLTNEQLPNALGWLYKLPGKGTPIVLLGWLAASTLLIFLASRGVQLLKAYIQTGVGTGMIYRLGATLFEHLQHLSLRFHGKRSTGDLLRRVTKDSGCLRELVISFFIPLLTSLVSLVSMFAIMWKMNRPLSLLAIFVAPPLVLVIRIFAHPMTERTYQQQELEAEMMSRAEQTLTALPVVQSFTREKYEQKQFHSLTQRTLKAYLRALASQLKFNISVGSVTAIGTAGIMVFGGFKVLNGTLSLGSLLVFLAYLNSLYTHLEALAYSASGYASAAASARRVLEVIDVEDSVRDHPSAKPFPDVSAGERGHIVFDGITFGYESDRPVLHDIYLEAHPSEAIALVGPTGAGKSTLVSLIPRFFDPWEGKIIVDGVDAKNIKLRSLRDHVSLVLQEPFLLPLTVVENISYGRSHATQEEIERMAKAAHAHEFIMRLPQGYETVIGERGATLSGGEKQRLAIARALLKDAPILILDEPTSALDAQTESLLFDALQHLMKNRTTFIIAHRLSTVRNASQIVVLEEGRVVEKGTHDELMAKGGVYHRFHKMQFSPTFSPSHQQTI